MVKGRVGVGARARVRIRVGYFVVIEGHEGASLGLGIGNVT